MKKLLVVALLSSSAHAGPYIELGAGFALGDTCIISESKDACYDKNPLGVAAIGYSWKRFDLKLEHWSSLPVLEDRGGEILSIRYRYEFKVPAQAGSQQ